MVKPSVLDSVRLQSLPEARRGLPLVIAPHDDRRAEWLAEWLSARAEWVAGQLLEHGAILLRGFDVTTALRFESVARAIAPELANDYLGTSPRNALTPYVFSASELPPHYPIPQHCEMSFLPRPPQRLFFCALEPSVGLGGETPLVDFARVAADLDPAVRARFEAKGVRNIRNYAAPGARRKDLWQLKPWDDMFGTTDRDEVERKCREHGFEWQWRDGGALRLLNTQPALQPHPVTGAPVWFNHSQVFHFSAAQGELRRVGRRAGQLRSAVLARVIDLVTLVRSRLNDPEALPMHATYGDGSPIPDRDMDAVREAIWANLVAYRWQRGDVVAIDNRRVSHGRMPYHGPRKIAVAWAS
ncbi:MAG: TauD/TfdA family dioxygenase [Deltaproteobacteria bacterium]|nr:TauD/TfdA family dioxygenase [Nannocystaceae bacterium]